QHWPSASLSLSGFDGTDSIEKIVSSLKDDINSPQALAIALELCKMTNYKLDTKELMHIPNLQNIFERIFQYFGVKEEVQAIPENVQELVGMRAHARSVKNFAESDSLRDEIAALGYMVEDGPDGQTVRKK
ncbi:MAG: hypothetical protein WBP40_05065, partial [Candidatus Moraniibacteriota bacterium]